jgi:hypothetical protein
MNDARKIKILNGLETLGDRDGTEFELVIRMMRPGAGSGRGFFFFKYEIIKS